MARVFLNPVGFERWEFSSTFPLAQIAPDSATFLPFSMSKKGENHINFPAPFPSLFPLKIKRTGFLAGGQHLSKFIRSEWKTE